MIIGENIIVIRVPKTFCFNFDFSKDVNENLKNEIEFFIKSNESIAEKETNKIEQFFLKYKHGSNSHKHGKQQKKSTT